MFNEKQTSLEVGNKLVTISTGKLAKQTSASVVVSCLDTRLLVTVTASEQPREGIDFFPLMVDFEEKLYSVGKIPGSYNRREGRASDKAILVSRLIDRPVRPLFKDGYRNDVQISAITLSVDDLAPPDTLAMLGAAFALELAGLPMDGPWGAVRVILDEAGNFAVNPSEAEQNASGLDIVVAGTEDSIMMVEAGANFIADSKVVDAIAFAHEAIKKQVQVIKAFAKECGVTKSEFTAPEINKQLLDIIEKETKTDLIASMQNATKASRRALVDAAKEKAKAAIAALGEDSELAKYLAENKFVFGEELKKFEKKLLRKQIKETLVRADGRKPDQVRPIYVEAGLYPRVHGDALFTRGDTQVLSITTLGTERMARSLDGIDSETEKFYMHNYNFPGWSVGEARAARAPGRREIGHGALAERAIIPALPPREDFPYTIRVVSEVLESAGSTSMASTCASSLSLMDAGVPMKTPVAGVAMGLIQEGDQAIVLTDIHELEDFLGDMDFKVAGNSDGISALQMDIKIKGISMETVRRAIEQALQGRLHILGEMNRVLSESRPEMRETAPRVTSVKIDTEKIGAVIGPSGKNIKWIIEQSGAEIDISDDGRVNIFSTSGEAAEIAKKYVLAIAVGPQPGDVWDGTVVKILDGIGAIVEIFSGTSGLVHISQLAQNRVEKVDDIVEIGQKVRVKVQGFDMKGRLSLSMKALEQENALA